jgi:5S rRNA maturation endonuclease (ribonuclease M5)
MYGDQQIDLNKVTRLYPAALIPVPDDTPAQVSLDWAESKADKVEIEGYVLVFDFDKHGNEIKNRIEITFETKEALDEQVAIIASLFNE